MAPHNPSNPIPLKSPCFKPAPRRGARTADAAGWDGDGDADGGGFSAYMRAKNRKLRAQFSAQYSAEKGASPSSPSAPSPADPAPKRVLRGVVVWVDGYTSPSRLRLRDLVGRHGGTLETYFDANVVTHVVAETLAAATLKRLDKCVRGGRVRVVTPAWVVDSVREARRLPERLYAVKGMRDRAQKSVAEMFGPKKAVRAEGKRVSKVQLHRG